MCEAMTVIMGICAIIATLLAPVLVVREWRLHRRGAITEGTVVHMGEDSDGSPTARVEYVVDGSRYTLEAGTAQGFRQGDHVHVRYLPDAPVDASVDETARVFGGTIVSVSLAVVFWVMTAVFGLI